ncbi:MAG: glycosyltransferase family 4 protein [Planctomycetota bacterium]|jgi:glycosyltransferase involved in cell wall biosynthesis|nr:glycosyltransferase family 4 protein [Planctomycetota bacterium]
MHTPHSNGANTQAKTSPAHPTPSRIAFLGGFPPRLCGIATFTHDLCEAVAHAAPATMCFAGAVNDQAKAYPYPPRVRFELAQQDLHSYRSAADFLNFSNADALCIQHEFGIYGGPAGSHLLALLKEVRMPVITTLHTILSQPDANQRLVMDELIGRSDRLVVMAAKGRDILRETYAAPADKIAIIPHGIPDMPLRDSESYKAQFGVAGRAVLLTFGLLGPGKGIEHAIQALPAIVARHPNVVYLILGATHPHLVATEGESYRLSLKRLAEDLGVKAHVIFHKDFVSLDDLKEFIGATDVYVTPYLNEAQITSGTLAYVFGAGKAVVSTPYWHAQEILKDGCGTLVPFRDPPAIAEGVCQFLDNPEVLRETQIRAHAIGRDWIWPAVAKCYLDCFEDACSEHRAAPRAAFADWTLASRPNDLPMQKLDHVLRMSDGTGIFQHATFTVPNFHEGYSIDDNARAFILCILLDQVGAQPKEDQQLDRIATSYLAFLTAAFNPDTNRFRNFMSHGRQWLEDSGSEDSHGRALWALGTGAGRSRNTGQQKLSRALFDGGLPIVESFSSPRAWTFALLGVHEYLRRFPDQPEVLAARTALTTKLIDLWHGFATTDWPWFELSVTYDNARLCQALILSGRHMPHPEALDIGLTALRWLVALQTTPEDHFRPIGSDGFYHKNGKRANYDQQPVEAQAMVSASLEAFTATGDDLWSREAKRAFEWFLGRNDRGQALYDSSSGGCRDGLHHDRLSENQGAESTLAFHLALAEMKAADHALTAPTGLI